MKPENMQDRLVRNIVEKLKAIDPELATMLLTRWRSKVNMAGWLDDLTSVVGDVVGEYTNIALDKERAKINAQAAKDIAKSEALLMEQQTQQLLLQAQSDQRRQELITEQFELQKFIKEMELEKWQKMGLWVAGGLALMLVVNRMVG